jgi:hypothetical protein
VTRVQAPPCGVITVEEFDLAAEALERGVGQEQADAEAAGTLAASTLVVKKASPCRCRASASSPGPASRISMRQRSASQDAVKRSTSELRRVRIGGVVEQIEERLFERALGGDQRGPVARRAASR